MSSCECSPYLKQPACLQKGGLESLKLQKQLRNSVQDAVESLGGRVTVGDVAAKAGVTINEAEEALNALAADCGGSLEVRKAWYSTYYY